MTKHLVATFMFQGESATVEAQAMDDLKYGFFITEDHQWADGSDWKYWIPPSQIEYIEKVAGGGDNI